MSFIGLSGGILLWTDVIQTLRPNQRTLSERFSDSGLQAVALHFVGFGIGMSADHPAVDLFLSGALTGFMILAVRADEMVEIESNQIGNFEIYVLISIMAHLVILDILPMARFASVAPRRSNLRPRLITGVAASQQFVFLDIGAFHILGAGNLVMIECNGVDMPALRTTLMRNTVIKILCSEAVAIAACKEYRDYEYPVHAPCHQRYDPEIAAHYCHSKDDYTQYLIA